ncbi:Folylpolyglutamate synthase [Hondaea fermentalgiana]|uniref:tetrahydrofolate synthase n=1 Tax=Hondaea fermentalgiana TaxID=2315210 RepID=A0A2R5GJH3_9STRA|nr:Folylpolyglutamate synthase [Hondaea fermentalgiana]|eukprot:GBG30469.1 Folylpolyglutamate synthase [Hondaea fermentalgiana]
MASQGGVEDRIMRLVRSSPPPDSQPPPKSREALLELYTPHMEALGLEVGPGLDARLAPRVVHVAGTKGKGSTCAMVESICRAAGLRTGLFTSPHLVRPHERVRLQGQPVSEEILAKHFDEVSGVLKSKNLMPGFFSFITLLGFHIFAAQELDVVIIEVGLGGRLDVTNLLGAPTACAVTLLDMDHTEYLGTTIEAIAGEKAGIFKPGVPIIVSSGQDPGALGVLHKTAEKVLAGPLRVADRFPSSSGVKLGLAGDHQYVNAGIAVALCEAAIPADKLTPEVIRTGLERCRWPGRSQRERLDADIDVLLDGAHTPKSLACALAWARSELQLQSTSPESSPQTISEPGIQNVSGSLAEPPSTGAPEPEGKETREVLLFSCMHSRDPLALFAEFKASGLRFDQVYFAPALHPKPTHVRMKTSREILGEVSVETEDDKTSNSNDSWNDVLCEVWTKTMSETAKSAAAYGSLQAALDAIKADAHAASAQAEGKRTTVLVTGSLLLVGDTMKLWDLPVA